MYVTAIEEVLRRPSQVTRRSRRLSPADGEVQEKEEGDLLEAEIAEAIAQPVIDPGEVSGQCAHAGGIHGVDSAGRMAHGGNSGAKKSPLLWGGAKWNT